MMLLTKEKTTLCKGLPQIKVEEGVIFEKKGIYVKKNIYP